MLSVVDQPRVALVCGGSRGIGRGCAVALGRCGYRVWITGRTRFEGQSHVPLPGSLAASREAIERAGGQCVVRVCDHTDDAAVASVFEELAALEQRLDVLVNGVWGGYERFVGVGELSFGRFWEQPLALWDSMHGRGVRTSYVAASLAARVMVPHGRGVIVNLTSFAGRRFVPPVAYGVAHAAIERMTADMARELAGTGVTVVALCPGIVRTENVLANAAHFDLSDSESPEFVGRVIAALTDDPELAGLSGETLITAELAAAYGVTEDDGTQPRSLRADFLDT
jgi:NAD(P)-dependent dehydrogenase (short-subunit alcohol dehydrogenase family)